MISVKRGIREPLITSYYVLEKHILQIQDEQNIAFVKKIQKRKVWFLKIKPSEHKIIFSIDGFCIRYDYHWCVATISVIMDYIFYDITRTKTSKDPQEWERER